MATTHLSPAVLHAAIYARISSVDRLPDGSLDVLGVLRQIEDCVRYCERMGWTYEIFTENNRSASTYAKKRRVEFDRLLDRVRGGAFDVIVVAELSRYTREPRIVEDLIDLSVAGTVDLVSANGGAYDVSTPEGKMRLRNEATFAASYSDFISYKMKRKKQQLRDGGDAPGGTRAFGYKGSHDVLDTKTGKLVHQKAGTVIEPKEAAAIKLAVRDVIAGTAMAEIARRWNAAGFRTPRKGAEWGVPSVRVVLTNPRNAALLAVGHGRDGRRIEYEIVGPANWPAIITRHQFDKLCAVVNDPARRKKSPARRSLLTGFVVCGRCGHTMVSHGAGTLRCKSLPENTACGKNAIRQAELEAWIVEHVQIALTSPKFWRERDKQQRARAKDRKDVENPDDIERELDDLAEAITRGNYSVRVGATISKGLEQRLAAARAALTIDTDDVVLDGFRDTEGEIAAVRKLWDAKDVGAQRAVLHALINRIEIAPRPDEALHTRGLWDAGRINTATLWKA